MTFVKNGAYRRAEQSPAPTKIVCISGCSGICDIRIPSGAARQRPYPFWPYGPFPPDRGNRPLVPKGSLGLCGFAFNFCSSQLPAATSQSALLTAPLEGEPWCGSRQGFLRFSLQTLDFVV